MPAMEGKTNTITTLSPIIRTVRLLILYLISAGLLSSVQVLVGASETFECKTSPSTVRWDANPESKVVDVDWRQRYPYRNTCDSSKSCHGDDPGQGQDEKLPLQHKPIQLQKGNKLRFYLNKKEQSSTNQLVYKVNATAFPACDVTYGDVIHRQSDGNDVFDVPESALNVGSNYFIVASDKISLVYCLLGRRLRVTLKEENCTGNDTGVCGGRGICATNNYQSAFACQCCGPYKGENCSAFDACLSHPCKNGGECISNDNDNETSGYHCKCAIGFYGEDCEKTAVNLCDVTKCHNNGTCTGNDTSAFCTCVPGWTGTQCEIDIDDCANAPCRHGNCVDKLNGYDCFCYPGYHGPDCGERHSKCDFGPCENGGFCENRTTSMEFKYVCHCPPGWNGRDCSEKTSACRPNPCTHHGICMETEDGGYHCRCNKGYKGHHCEININDCQPNPCRHGGQCTDLLQGHMCRCFQTFIGADCQYSQRLYLPGYDGIDTHVIIVNDGDSDTGMSILAGVLTASIIIVIVVLVGCYCRVTGSWGNNCVLRALMPKEKRDLTVQVNIANTADCPLTSDSFFQESQNDLGIDNRAYTTELV